MDKKHLLILAAVILAACFYFKAPSADSIAKEMRVHVDTGRIEYKGVTYIAEWGDQSSHSGDIRYIGRAYDKYAPYITNDAIVTTEEFSDPSIVKVTPIKKGNMRWQSHKNPKGSLIAESTLLTAT